MSRVFTIVLIILISVTVSMGAVSPSRAHLIYSRIISANNISNPPKLTVVKGSDPNAYSSGNTIEITTSMLSFAYNDHEIARVLGHELGHLMLGHSVSNTRNEYAADKYAANSMRKAGYNVCKGAKLLKRRNMPDSSSHPSDYSRYKALGC